MSGEVVQSVRDRWSHVTATWANNKETGVSHVGDTTEATSYSKRRKLNIAKSLIVTLCQPRTLIWLISCNRGSTTLHGSFLISMETIACPIWCPIWMDLTGWTQNVRYFTVSKLSYLIIIS